MEIKITTYEDWMKPQVAKLFSDQYGVTENYFAALMDNFYDHPFQKQKCIRIAALDGEKVVGFQSFFYWPYFFEGKKLNSFQSGNSLVHPEYRGKHIFQQLLEFLDQQKEKMEIDFLVGFPIVASRNSLLKNKWKNPFDLQWYIKPMNFFAMLKGNERKKLPEFFKTKSESSIKQNAGDGLRLSDENDFRQWRHSYSKQETYYYHLYTKDGKSIEFVLKCIRRKK